MPQTLPPLRERVIAPTTVDLPEPRAGVTWRPMNRGDAEAVHALRRAAGLIDHPHFIVTLEEIRQVFDRDEVEIAKDTVLAQDPSGRVIAYGTTLLLPGSDTLVRCVLDGAVHPDRRREGLGTQLLQWHERRGLQLLGTSDDLLPGWLLAFADERATGLLSLFERNGFELRRWWLELARDLSEPVPVIALDPAVDLVQYGPAWSEATRDARNEAFRDHFGSQPTVQAIWEAHDRLPIARPDLSFLAVERTTGVVVGFVLSEVNQEEWPQFGRSFGYINYVGVRRGWRGRKIAQALLAHTLAVYRDEGFERAVLDVDSESPTGALGLYEGLGFRPVNRSVSLIREY